MCTHVCARTLCFLQDGDTSEGLSRDGHSRDGNDGDDATEAKPAAMDSDVAPSAVRTCARTNNFQLSRAQYLIECRPGAIDMHAYPLRRGT